MEEYNVTSLVAISRFTVIINNFLQHSDNCIYRWAGGGFLRPTPLDETPHSIRHTYSIGRSFWPLTVQDSLKWMNIDIVREDWGACINLMPSIVER